MLFCVEANIIVFPIDGGHFYIDSSSAMLATSGSELSLIPAPDQVPTDNFTWFSPTTTTQPQLTGTVSQSYK